MGWHMHIGDWSLRLQSWGAKLVMRKMGVMSREQLTLQWAQAMTIPAMTTVDWRPLSRAQGLFPESREWEGPSIMTDTGHLISFAEWKLGVSFNLAISITIIIHINYNTVENKYNVHPCPTTLLCNGWILCLERSLSRSPHALLPHHLQVFA